MKAQVKYKIRFVADLASDPDNFYVRVWPVVQTKYKLTDVDRREIERDVKRQLKIALGGKV